VYSASNGDARKASISTLLTYIEQAWMSPAFERVTASPTLSGFTLTLPTGANSLFVLLTPTGTMATGTIVLPPAASAADGQEVVLFTSQEVTALTFTLNGATAVNGAPTGIQAGASLTLRYDVLSVAWYTTEKPSSVGSGTVNFLPKWTAPTTLANSIVRDNGTEVSIGGAPIPGQKFVVYGNQFNFQSDADTAMSVCNAASTAPRTALFEASNYTDGTTGTAGFRSNIARGTLLTPAAVVSGDDLGAFISRAHDGTGFFEAGRIQFDAQSNWAAGRSSSITLSTCASGIVGDRLYISPTGNVQLATNGTSFIASGTGQGIKLPATPINIDPNTLDAYDEGTFTPVYNGTGVVGTVTFSCRYQRTGNQVTLEITIVVAAGSSLTYTYATDFLNNIPASVHPSVDLSVGSYVFDSLFFIIAKAGGATSLRFAKSGVASFSLLAGQGLRAQVTYMI
jgi:hypothetical protein